LRAGATKVRQEYQFGDSDLAAERLAEVARVFRDSSASFLQQVAGHSFEQVVDLDCGPGFTTRLLAEVLGADRTSGLDKSVNFLDSARRHNTPGVEYFQHDVRGAPFPCGAADLVYCRYLLSHLPEVRTALEIWATQLEPGGLMRLDEVEAIHTSNPWFEKYLGIVEGMLDASGSRLYVGPVLESAVQGGQLRIVGSDIRRMDVANRDAAAMFSRNVPNWRTNDYIQANFREADIDELLARLLPEAAAPANHSEITWELRQMILA
jgi:SAM-dependent methyltransferase